MVSVDVKPSVSSLVFTCCSLGPSSWKMCVDPHRELFRPQPCLTDLVLKIPALPAHTTGKLYDQVNPGKFLIYRDTVWKVKWCVSGENGHRERGLNYNMCKQVFFFFLFFFFSKVVPGWSTFALATLPHTHKKKDALSSFFFFFSNRRLANRLITASLKHTPNKWIQGILFAKWHLNVHRNLSCSAFRRVDTWNSDLPKPV